MDTVGWLSVQSGVRRRIGLVGRRSAPVNGPQPNPNRRSAGPRLGPSTPSPPILRVPESISGPGSQPMLPRLHRLSQAIVNLLGKAAADVVCLQEYWFDSALSEFYKRSMGSTCARASPSARVVPRIKTRSPPVLRATPWAGVAWQQRSGQWNQNGRSDRPAACAAERSRGRPGGRLWMSGPNRTETVSRFVGCGTGTRDPNPDSRVRVP